MRAYVHVRVVFDGGHAASHAVVLQIALFQGWFVRVVRIHVDFAQFQARKRVCVLVVPPLEFPIPISRRE